MSADGRASDGQSETPWTISVSAPLRLSLAGGGTDLPEWYTRMGAHVLSVAIQFRVQLRFRRASEIESQSDLVDLFKRRSRMPWSVGVSSPIAPGAGLGGSGALAVALVAAERVIAERPIDPLDVALEGYRWERELLGRPVGFQDHVASAFGSCTEMRAERDGSIDVRRRDDLIEPLTEMFETSVVLVETGERRDAAVPLSQLSSMLESVGRVEAAGLAVPAEVEEAIRRRDGALLGAVLGRHWRTKVALNGRASTMCAEQILAVSSRAGAAGGKLVGAGGGGMVLLAGPSSCRDAVEAACSEAGFATRRPAVSMDGVTVDLETSGHALAGSETGVGL